MGNIKIQPSNDDDHSDRLIPVHCAFRGGSGSKDDAQQGSIVGILRVRYLFGCEVGSMNWNSTTHVLSFSCRC